MTNKAKSREELLKELLELHKDHDALKASYTLNLADGRLAEKKFQDSDSHYRAILNASPDDITITDLTGQVRIVSDSALSMFGIASREDVLGHSMTEYLAPEDRERGLVNFTKMLQGVRSGPVEYKGLRPDGSTLDIEVNGEFVRDDKGNPISMMFIVRNITQRKEIESQLINAKEKAEESDRLKSAFLTNMSHEIRTPMNGILGFTELLKEPDLSGSEQQKYIRIIEKSGARLLNLINNIIDLSKIESGQMETSMAATNVNEQAEDIFYFFKPEVEQKGIKFSTRYALPSKEAIIQTDSEKLYAILTNLVKNAIKFTYAGSIEFGYEKQGDCLEFFVKDTGIGIPFDRQDAIFQRFIQADITGKSTQQQGAGLGLTIAKGYVEMLGGKMRVESEPEKGSTFFFTIPYHAVTEKQIIVNEVIPVTGINKRLNKLKLLIVEDDETSEIFINKVVEDFSSEVFHANTGREAIEICHLHPDIDLVLMDIRMPIMNGYDATQQIRAFNKDVIIVAQTAFALTGDKEKALAAGCDDYISKPVSKNQLLEIIDKYF
ncbi:MAG: ATP-binding protein [Bacteroidota bacterium]